MLPGKINRILSSLIFFHPEHISQQNSKYNARIKMRQIKIWNYVIYLVIGLKMQMNACEDELKL
jgi:hypothetical protein